jgi:hypothetical protein
MVRSQRLLADLDNSAQQRLGLRESVAVLVKYAEAAEALDRGGMLPAESAFTNFDGLFQQRFRLVVAPHIAV